MATAHAEVCQAPGSERLIERLNGAWHERANQLFMVIILAHWAEHLFQAFQVYVLRWPVPQALGALGLVYPWLVKSEVMHYAYALIMLAGIWLLRSGFNGTNDRRWWTIALVIQFVHHFEHLLLQGQAIVGMNLLGRPVPTSLVQLWIPRVELHLIYNTIVFVPMLVAMYYHLFPTREEAAAQQCTCAWHSARVASAT